MTCLVLTELSQLLEGCPVLWFMTKYLQTDDILSFCLFGVIWQLLDIFVMHVLHICCCAIVTLILLFWSSILVVSSVAILLPYLFHLFLGQN